MDIYLSKQPAAPSPSWRVFAGIIGIAVAINLLIINFPVFWVILAGVVAISIQVRNQVLSLAVLMFACGLLNYSPYESGAFSRLFPGDIAIAFFLVMWLVRSRSLSFRQLFRPDLINAPLLGIIFVTVISMAHSRFAPDPYVTYTFPHSDVSWGITQISQLGLLVATSCMPFAVAAAITSWRHIEIIIISIAAVAAIGTIVTLGALEFNFGGDFQILGATRAYWEQPWQSSMSLTALILPFLCSAILFGRKSVANYGLMWVLLILCSIGVVITFSRESWLLAAFGMVYVVVARMGKKALIVIALASFVLLMTLAMSPSALLSVTRFYNPDEVYGLDRVYFYITALQLFASHPVWGVGAGNYQFFDRVYAEVSSGGIAHNQFLTIAAEMGILGILAFLWFLVRLMRIRKAIVRGSRDSDPHHWLKVAISVFVLSWIAQCFFSEAFFVSAAAGGGTLTITVGIFAWILLGVLFSMSRLELPPVTTA